MQTSSEIAGEISIRDLTIDLVVTIDSATALGVAFVGGATVSKQPWGVIPFAGLAGLLVLNALSHHTQRLFLGALGFLIIGFLFQSRAFSYIGIAPLYVSEFVLLLGVGSLLFSRGRWRPSATHLMIYVFMGIGLLRTVPYLSEYGVLAIRDSAQWYYASFAILVSLFLTRNRIEAFLHVYAWLLPLLIVWLAILPLLILVLPATLPTFPGSPLPLVSNVKAGDRAVILAGLGAFMATGLYGRFTRPVKVPSFVLWAAWFVAVGFVAATSRGGFLSVVVGFSPVALFIRSREWVTGILMGTVMLVSLVVINPSIDLGGDRNVSVDQLLTNVASIFSDDAGNAGYVQGTKEWRLQWWDEIYEDTVKGEYFWSGQGFGVNLASTYGFQTDSEGSLRSPHNGHLTILARMGVPGLVTWVVLQIAFLGNMIRILRTARQGSEVWGKVAIWLLAIWTAIHINGAFDVYLESPYGAIPFWCVMGAGLALSGIQHEDGRLENT